jgi:hypothetical protein
LKELRELVAQFSRDNPSLRYVGFARFTDLGRMRAEVASKRSAGPNSLLGLFYIDPFAGLDPVARELSETRSFAERSAFMIQRMPIILQWQVELAMSDVSDMPIAQQFVTASTGLAKATTQIADTTASYPAALATEREAAITQLDRAVAAQRRALLTDLTTAVDAQRRALIDDLTRAVDAQRRALVADLDVPQAHVKGLLGDVNNTLDRAERAGLSINSGAARTVDATEQASRRTLVFAFALAVALLFCALIGIPISALIYRRLAARAR